MLFGADEADAVGIGKPAGTAADLRSPIVAAGLKLPVGRLRPAGWSVWICHFIQQAPARFSATNLTPGYHVFSVLGTDSAGMLRSSDPVMVVVRKLPPKETIVTRTNSPSS